MTDDILVEAVAKAIYKSHSTNPELGWTWLRESDREWFRRDANAAIDVIEEWLKIHGCSDA